ncbi:PQQ-binding-like beta-propeller repeat protein [candidate division KSB1 bacterium]|nr:PQQ-binding-like beta-propeller repeat protein [candidate division KSB1 bacterium]
MKIVRIILLVAIASLLTAGFTHSSDSGDNDWPSWRGKDTDGKASQKGVFKFDQGYGLKIGWKKPLGSSYSSVSIADGRAVTMYSDSTFDYVIALDTNSGDELWRFKIDSTFKFRGGSHNGQISTPTIAGDKVFAYTRRGRLLALSAQDGSLIWSHDVTKEIESKEPVQGFGSSPLVVGDILFCQVGGTADRTVCGFNKDTGEVQWSAISDTVNYQSPIFTNLLGEDQIIGVGDHQIFGVNPKSGNVLWRHRFNNGSGSSNPVVVENDKIFLNHVFGPGESFMLQVKKENGKYSVEELWKSRDIKQTFNASVYHNGYLYSYSGRFITCVDANTGEKVWKSRPPGDGFLIMVDDHLVIVTKQGTLHVAKASPEDYIELASIKVFDGLTWTAPSFANGSIYLRNLYEIARVDIAKVDQLTLDQPEVELLNPDGDFAKFLNKVDSASENDKKMLVDKFMKSQKSFPVIEDNRFVHLVHHEIGTKDVAVTGDMFNFRQDVAMNRVEGTDFFFLSFELEPDARVSYQLKHFENVITDPLNPHKVRDGGPNMQGEASDLRMPKWKPATHFQEPKAGVARGTIETFEFESEISKSKRNVHVYLPAGYADSKDRYPVLYVNNGKGAKDQMLMPNSLDNLIAAKEMTPVIAVFVEQSSNRRQASREYSRNGRDKFAQMFAEELVPHIDQKYRTKADADSRVVTGGDEGGFAAFYTAFKYPDVFHNVGGQSTHLHKPAGGDALTKIVSESKKLPINIYMDWGKYDLTYQNGLSWIQLNEDFMKSLQEKGYSVEGGQVNDGFGWASWRNRTDKILETFFPLKKKTMK